jgi:hypothetical protein
MMVVVVSYGSYKKLLTAPGLFYGSLYYQRQTFFHLDFDNRVLSRALLRAASVLQLQSCMEF